MIYGNWRDKKKTTVNKGAWEAVAVMPVTVFSAHSVSGQRTVT